MQQIWQTKDLSPGYTYKEDFISEAILTVLKYIQNFNPEKTTNAFSYVTQICYHAFINYIKKQKKHSAIKDLCFQNQNFINEETYAQRGVDYTIFNSMKECDIENLENNEGSIK